MSLRPPLAFNPRPRRLSTPTDAFQLHPDIASYGTPLSGGRFRALNEKLYTATGADALAMVTAQPGMFAAYHAGFREQTKEWPSRPVDVCARWLRAKPDGLVVADLGCGDAELATLAGKARSILRRSPYDRVGVVHAVP